MPDDRARWLIIAYEFSGYKRTCFYHINRYVGSSPSSQSKIEVPVQVWSSKFKSKIHTEIGSKTVRELQILRSNSPWTALMQRNKLKLTQQKREEPNSAETIHIWNTELQTINKIILYSMLIITVRNYGTNTITCNCTTNTRTMYSHL